MLLLRLLTDSTIDLWHFQKKKPLDSVVNAHGLNESGEAHWISGLLFCVTIHVVAIVALRYSDLFASGSADGTLKLWRVSSGKIAHVKDIPMVWQRIENVNS